MKIRAKAPRFIHRLYALFMGYFWHPCPICTRMIGGHERHAWVGLYEGEGISALVCPDCEGEARRMNSERWGYQHPVQGPDGKTWGVKP
jgi:hypothetical protein